MLFFVYVLIQVILFDRDVFQRSYKSLKMAHGGLKVASAVCISYGCICARVGYKMMDSQRGVWEARQPQG